MLSIMLRHPSAIPNDLQLMQLFDCWLLSILSVFLHWNYLKSVFSTSNYWKTAIYLAEFCGFLFRFLNFCVKFRILFD